MCYFSTSIALELQFFIALRAQYVSILSSRRYKSSRRFRFTATYHIIRFMNCKKKKQFFYPFFFLFLCTSFIFQWFEFKRNFCYDIFNSYSRKICFIFNFRVHVRLSLHPIKYGITIVSLDIPSSISVTPLTCSIINCPIFCLKKCKLWCWSSLCIRFICSRYTYTVLPEACPAGSPGRHGPTPYC